MAKTREDIELSEAVDATEKELFAAALGDEPAVHDDSGDQSLEHPDRGLESNQDDLGDETEVDVAPEGEAEEIEAAADPDKGPKKDPATGKFVAKEAAPDHPDQRVPAGRLRETAERARAAEDRVKAVEAEREALKAERETERKDRDALRAQMDLLVRQQAAREASQQPRQETKAAPVRPDKFADPDGYDAWVEGQIAQARNDSRDEFSKRLVNMNLAATHQAHGEKFEAAYQSIITAAQSDPEARIAIQKIWNSDNPGGELMNWHRNRETLRQVGNDPDAYRKKIADETRAALLADPEFRKEMLAGLRDDAGGKGGTQPRHVTRPPIRTNIPSLNGANGAANLAELNQAAIDDPSDEGAFNRALS